MKTQNVSVEKSGEDTDCTNNLQVNHKGLKLNKEIIAENNKKTVITLKEIVDIINISRAEREQSNIQHSKAMAIVSKMSRESPSFGEVSKYDTLNLNGVKIETSNLTKNQAIAVGGKLDTERLMIVVNKIEELENKTKAPLQKMPTYLETAKMLVQSLEENEALVLTNKTLEKQNTILMHTNKLFTATEIAKELGFKSAMALNKQLSELKIQYKVNNSWVLRADYADKGYTSIKQDILENGKEIYDRKWTQTGRDFILKLFATKEEAA